jgi:hypothetical protein
MKPHVSKNPKGCMHMHIPYTIEASVFGTLGELLQIGTVEDQS